MNVTDNNSDNKAGNKNDVPQKGIAKKYKILGALVFLIIAGTAVSALRRTAVNQGYAPTQPIPFSHKLHAGQYNIPCMYCHVGVEKSRHATIPSTNICMNCHSQVKTDSPHIAKIREAFESGKPIEWVKVHDMPDHVYFNHKRHVTKGIACETCHGDVKKMAVVKQAKALSMGWCLDCHRGQNKELPASIAKAEVENPHGTGIPKGGVAPVSCYTCHR